MTGTDVVQLRNGPEGSVPGRVDAWNGERLIAVLNEQPTDTGTRVFLLERQAPIDPTDVRALLDALTERALQHGGTTLELASSDPLVRDLARRRQLTGALRSPLIANASTRALPPRAVGTGTPTDPEAIRTEVQALLPDVEVGLSGDDGPVRALLRRAVSGVPRTFNLFAMPEPGASVTRFSVPNRSDLLSESIARCIDTTIAIRRRFGRVAATARRVSFDHADFQLLHGHHAGSADRSVGVIHMNASYASVEGMTAMETVRAERSSGGGSAGVQAPFNQIDGTTAHEVWHQMEGALEGRRSMDGIELRRRLGEALGVETLEQAINGVRPRAPESWKHAYVRLVEEVSPYGATAPVEATAEMFKLWWCATGPPSPIVAQFGELIQAMLADFRD